MKRRLLLAIWALCCLPVAAQNLSVYMDALANGFVDGYSFPPGDVNLSATMPVHAGLNSISWLPHNYSGLSFARPSGTLSTANYNALSFWIWCSADCTRPLFLSFALLGNPNDTILKNADLANAYPQGVLPTMQWTQITISLDSGLWALAPNAVFDRFNLQDQANNLAATNIVYIDDVQLIARAAGPPPPPSTAPLAYTASSTVNGISGSQFTWIDSTDNPRSAHMATGTGGVNKGGVLNQFIYRLANGSTRTVNQSGCCGAGGFGYIVSHLANPNVAQGDDSPLGPPQGDNPGGATQTVFAGRHHALHMYTLNYPRWGLNAGMVPTKYNMAVTIGWVFATGRNHPLWTVTFDMNQMPADAVVADTRAPYGDMNFDGTLGEGQNGDIVSGVGWGDLYKFRSTTAPFTLNSGWTWNTPNTIPHNMLWTNATDSEMGIVLTQPIAQQDAGGYFGVNQWMMTSANGRPCANPPSVMPCDFTWPFQSINYSFGGNSNVTTQSKRLAWGADFGYIGQSNYPDRATGGNRSGYPYHSYSTYIVLDQHSRTPTDTQVSQMETRQISSVSATVGAVAASGLAGLGRVDLVNYQPSGFDPIFDAWTFIASGNNATVSLTTPAPYNLRNPLIILRGYNLATEPYQVRVAGITLTADVDYYASAIPGRSELWLTLRGQFQGNTSVEVTGSAPVGNFTVTPSAGANGSIAPNTAQTVASGATTMFMIAANAGYTANVAVGAGQCGGTLSGAAPNYSYTTASISANCAVTAGFTPAPVQCSVGTYSASGNTPCISASPGNFVSFVGAMAQTACAAGTYSAMSGAASCTPAAIGFFVANPGAFTQTMCAAGTTTLMTGATVCVPINYTVTPSAGASGSISPNAAQTVASGATTTFTVTPDAGYTASVGGTCGGNLVGTTYTTAAIAADCSVIANFSNASLMLLAVQSRKTHGGAGTFDLPINLMQTITQAVTVEPRTIGAGHLIVFQFNRPITIAGTAATTNGSVTVASSAQEVRVTLTGVTDNTRTTVSLDGVNGNVAATVSLGFLVGDVNNSRSVNASDISGVKARAGQPVTASNFQLDVNADGSITSADISAVKGRAGLVLQ